MTPPETTATTEADSAPTITFAELGLSYDVMTALKEVGYEHPSAIQAATIPTLLMFPVLAYVYARLARAEEREVAVLFPQQWTVYADRVHAYVPHRPAAAAPDGYGGSRAGGHAHR